jgi:ABC-type glycerol-3-phosphate transport system permease component
MTRSVKTLIGLVLTAIMLFPVYWMINVSFTKDTDMRASPPHLFPVHGTAEGYRAVFDQQLPYLGTSLLVGLGTVLLTVVLAAPAGNGRPAERDPPVGPPGTPAPPGTGRSNRTGRRAASPCPA